MPEAALVSLVMPASSSNIVGLRCPPFGCFRRMCCNRMASKASAKASLLWHQVVDVPPIAAHSASGQMSKEISRVASPEVVSLGGSEAARERAPQ